MCLLHICLRLITKTPFIFQFANLFWQSAEVHPFYYPAESADAPKIKQTNTFVCLSMHYKS